MEDVRIELINCQFRMETISKIWELERSKQQKVIMMLWRWWSARNEVNDSGRVWCAVEIHGSVTFFLLELKKLEVNGNKVQSLPFNLGTPENFYKIYTDGAYNQNTRTRGRI